MKMNLKKTSVMAFGLTSTLILAGCMNKTAPIGDFNSAIETYSALAQKNISQAAEIVDALTNFTNFSYLKQDGNETKYKGQPAYKLKLDEEQFYKELSDDLNALKAVVEKSNPLVIEDKEVEDKITPETLKEKIKIKEVEAYLVKFKNDEYRLAISKLILDIEEEVIEISNIPSEDKNTYTIKTKEVTTTINVLDRKQEGLKFDGKVVSEDIAFNILGSLVNETTDTSAKINFIIKFGLEKFVPFKEVEGLNIALTNTSTQDVSTEEVSAPVQYKLLSEIEQAQKKGE